MSNSIGEAVLDLVADGQALVGDIEDAKPGVLGALDNLGKVGGTLLAAGLGIAITALTGITAMVWDAGMTLDGAYDNIAVTTGKMGAELEALQEDFDQVFTSVPTDADSAATAIGILNSRLEMTGPVLQETSANLLEMTRITGGDLVANGEAFTRMVGDWSVPLKDSSGALDMVFVASQKTGIGTDRLMQLLVQFGAPLRQFGFGFEQSAAMLGKWEKEGVNVELVMGSLRIAAANFASENIPLKEGLEKSFNAIKNAKTESEALSLAMETFGAKAGPDMSAAIRENRFELGDLVGALQSADGAIMKTAESTMDWGERWTLFKNRMMVALGPAGMRLMGVVGSALGTFESLIARPDIQAGIMAIVDGIVLLAEAAANALPGLVDQFFGLVEWLKQNEGVVVAILAALGVAVMAFGVSVATAAWAAMAPLLPVIAIMLLVAGIAYLVYKAWTENWWGIRETTLKVLAFLKKVIKKVLDAIQKFWAEHGDEIIATVKKAWKIVVDTVGKAIEFVRKVIADGLKFIRALTNGELGWMSDVWDATWTIIRVIVLEGTKTIRAIIALFTAAMRGEWYTVGQQLRAIWDSHWRAMTVITSSLGKILVATVGEIVKNAYNMFVNTDWSAAGKRIVNGVIAGMMAMASAVVNTTLALVQLVQGFFGIEDWTVWGSNIVAGLVSGALNFANLIVGMAANLKAKVMEYFGITDFVEAGENMIYGIIGGVLNQAGALYNAFINMVNGIIGAIVDLFNGGSGDALAMDFRANFDAGAFAPGPGMTGLRGNAQAAGGGNGQMAVTFYAPVTFQVDSGDTMMQLLTELR
jgi:phage-related minor tail protein